MLVLIPKVRPAEEGADTIQIFRQVLLPFVVPCLYGHGIFVIRKHEPIRLLFPWKGEIIINRIALIGIIVSQPESVERLNAILHEYGQHIIGRMGIPRPDRQLSVISIALDAPQQVIASLSGKLGMLPGVSAKTVYAKEN